MKSMIQYDNEKMAQFLARSSALIVSVIRPADSGSLGCCRPLGSGPYSSLHLENRTEIRSLLVVGHRRSQRPCLPRAPHLKANGTASAPGRRSPVSDRES